MQGHVDAGACVKHCVHCCRWLMHAGVCVCVCLCEMLCAVM